MRNAFVAVALAGVSALPVLPQETKPAPVIQIARESIKEGKGTAHEKLESEWAAALRKANHPQTYAALDSMSGTSEAWFIMPAPSFATTEEWRKAADKEPLKSIVAMLDARDGELRSSSRTTWAVYRPALSYKPEKYNATKVRFVSVGAYRVKLGHDQEFEAAAKKVYGAYDKASLDVCILGYQAVAGAPSGTYLLFAVMDSLKGMDEAPARNKAILDAMGAEGVAQLQKSSGDIFVSIESTLLRVNPSMSYVQKSIIDADPAFWKPKPTAPAAAQKTGAQ
jgi:hypothetical protein